MQVKPLLDLRVTHPFYDDQRCADIVLAPTEVTATLMRRLNVTCRQFPDHVSLYAVLDSQGKSVAAAAAPLALSFYISPRDETFALITDLTQVDAQAAPLFTSVNVAVADPLPLRLTSRSLTATKSFSVATRAATEWFVLSGRPQPGVSAAAFTVTGTGFSLGFVSYDAVSNRIAVNTSMGAPGRHFDVAYPVLPSRPQDVLAEVELALDAAALQPPVAGPRSFVVSFAARALRWCYYLVADYAGDITTLTLVDATPGAGARRVEFDAGGPTDLSANPDASDSVALNLAKQNPGRRVLRFLSKAPVACTQTPLRALELRLDGTRVIGSVPNPAASNIAALATAPPPAARETVLYHVLRLIAN